jgi:hypothetical protein
MEIFKILDDRLASIKQKYNLDQDKYVLPVTQEEYQELKAKFSISMQTFPSETKMPDLYKGALLKVLSPNPIDDFTEYYYKFVTVLTEEYQQSRGMFICGYSLHNSPNGMPTMITICPGHGSDAMALYQLRKDLSSPGY